MASLLASESDFVLEGSRDDNDSDLGRYLFALFVELGALIAPEIRRDSGSSHTFLGSLQVLEG